MRVRYHGFDNASLKKQAAGLVSDMGDLWPTWVATLYVHQKADEDPEKAIAAIGCEPEYRQARLYLYPAFWTNDSETQVAALRHEVAHAHVAPLTCWIDKHLLNPMKRTDRALHRHLAGEFDERHEGAVEEISLMMGRLTDPLGDS